MHVAEDRIVPIGNVERAIGTELKIDWDARFVVRFEDLAEAFVIVGRSVLGPIMKKNALEVLVLVREDFALELVRPVPARDELLTAVAVILVPVSGIGDVTGLGLIDERCVVVTSDIEMFSPAIDCIAPGISSGREPGNDLQAMSSRVKSVDGIVLAAARSVNGLDLSIMKHALLHVEPSARPPDEVVDGMVTIFAPKAVQKNGLLICLIVAIGIMEENKVRLLRKVNSVLAELEAEWEVKIISKDGAFVGFAVLISVFENKNLVVGFDSWKRVRIGGHGRDPETSGSIKVDRDRVTKLGEFLL